ncbi:hypothetical protein HPB52_024345 [Rhipicephalus sanguineus]|uniref:Sm domain-containing protein n=1 Tax=Rhipicephalus sanguineus TaxID=34632 RepID=A0A9D4YR75_RHISA|nr:hypothetical protein HPB52_024345 [Rhipicephalus sanguineus]
MEHKSKLGPCNMRSMFLVHTKILVSWMLFYSFFKSLVGKDVVVELKNDLSMCGTLHSVDQYLNIKLTDISVTEQDKYPHMIASMGMTRNINAVRFTSDGSRILAATTARRLAVIDVERGEQVMTYDNCAYDTKDRASLAADPICPKHGCLQLSQWKGAHEIHVTVTPVEKHLQTVQLAGLTLFDLRMPLPLDFVYDLHDNAIRDLLFLHSSWPFVRSHQSTVLSLSADGVCKVTTLDGRYLHGFEVGHGANSVAATPEAYGSAAEDGFRSVLLVGGDTVSGYVPDIGVQERLCEHGKNSVWKLRYTSNGGLLYTACNGGIVRRYRRYPDQHKFLGEVLWHEANIQDMDLSLYDDCIL